MADIVALESEINRLDPSTFQRLCDFVMIHQGRQKLKESRLICSKDEINLKWSFLIFVAIMPLWKKQI